MGRCGGHRDGDRCGGGAVRRKVEIRNRTDQRRRIQLYAAAASVQGEEFRFAEGRTANELSSWISLDRPELDLRPGRQERVTATVRVPETASPGERYGVIWASTASEPKPNSVAKVNRVGVRVYLDIGPGGEPPVDFQIKDFVVARDATGAPKLSVGVVNTGGRAVDLSGALRLSHEREEISAGPFPVVDGTTLAPGQRGAVAVVLSGRLDKGPWRAELTLVSGLVERTATVSLTFPDPGEPPSTFELDGLPMILTGSAAAGLLALGVLLLLARHSRRRADAPGP